VHNPSVGYIRMITEHRVHGEYSVDEFEIIQDMDVTGNRKHPPPVINIVLDARRLDEFLISGVSGAARFFCGDAMVEFLFTTIDSGSDWAKMESVGDIKYINC
jgi:hypothetical protein